MEQEKSGNYQEDLHLENYTAKYEEKKAGWDDSAMRSRGRSGCF